MLSLHTRILAQLAVDSKNGTRRGSGHSPPRMLGARGAGGEKENVEGMDHDRSDVLAAEPRRKGGLTRSDNVSNSGRGNGLADCVGGDVSTTSRSTVITRTG